MLTYSELIRIPDFHGRLEYLRKGGIVGDPRFGAYRYLNQSFYRSVEWRRFRNQIIVRDGACDLAHPDYEIADKTDLVIHHLNSISIDDLINRSPILLDPENVVTTTLRTHNSIHYGADSLAYNSFVERRPNDTCPWK